jgi:hypothetical protein
MVITNSINLISDGPVDPKTRVNISASGVSTVLDEALRASQMIPERMSAFEAAQDFCYYMLDSLKENEEKAHKRPMECPAWFLR